MASHRTQQTYTHTHNTSLGASLLEVLAIIAIISVLLTLVVGLKTDWKNWSGLNQRAAIRNAELHVQALRERGHTADVVDCKKFDTEPDGNVSCTIEQDGVVKQVECAAWGWFDALADESCREPKLSFSGSGR